MLRAEFPDKGSVGVSHLRNEIALAARALGEAAARERIGPQSGVSYVSFNYLAELLGETRALQRLEQSGLCPVGAAKPPEIVHKAEFWDLCGGRVAPLSGRKTSAADRLKQLRIATTVHADISQSSTVGEALKRFEELAEVIDPDVRIGLVRGPIGLRVDFAYAPHLDKTKRREMYVENWAALLHCVLRWMT
jgi:hypothetical protein